MVAMTSVILCFRSVMSRTSVGCKSIFDIIPCVGVHKVSLQFQKFITKANEKTDKWKLLENERYVFKFFYFLI